MQLPTGERSQVAFMVGVRDDERAREVVVDPLVPWVDQHTEPLPRLPVGH